MLTNNFFINCFWTRKFASFKLNINLRCKFYVEIQQDRIHVSEFKIKENFEIHMTDSQLKYILLDRFEFIQDLCVQHCLLATPFDEFVQIKFMDPINMAKG